MDLNKRLDSAFESAARGDNTKAAQDYETLLQAMLNDHTGMNSEEHAQTVRSIAFNLAQVLNKLGRYQEALKNVDLGLSYAPTALGKAIAFAAKGEAFCGLGHSLEGRRAFAEATHAHPIVGRLNSAESMARLGTLELLFLAADWVNTVETQFGGRLNDSHRAEIKSIRQQIATNRKTPPREAQSRERSSGTTSSKGELTMQRTYVDFGIDLGTTNSTIAVIDGTDATVIPNKGGSGTTPSAVWIDKRGNLHVGAEAKQYALIGDPENADLEFKLRMGRGAEGKKAFVRSGREMLPEELSAEILKSLKMDVQTNRGEPVQSAVITVPAAFELPQANATQKAAKLAGFMHSPLLLEPVAASLAYGFQSTSDNVYWLVFDFGGGTFDAAIMRVRDGLIQVVNHDGDNNLGGKLIDWDIVAKRLIPAVIRDFNVPDFRRGNPKWSAAIGKMKWHAELAKIEVCRTRMPHEIWIEGLCLDADGKDVDFAYMLTPQDVEDVSRPYVERAIGLCNKALRDKGLSGSSMERILMVGGSTLSPWVREAVQTDMRAPLEFGIDPVTVVARGAAIFASTQPVKVEHSAQLPAGTWRIQIEHEPVGNVTDPDIGGRILPPTPQDLTGFTVEMADTKTQWRSGRIRLGSDGTFMTQLFADENRRCQYAIELCDATGTQIPTAPDHVVYTIGVRPASPPAAHTIGVGLKNDEMRPYIEKGTKLPGRGTNDHRTMVALRAGKDEDVLRIPILEGENARATRNHPIGVFELRGSKIGRDLPVGSQVEVIIILNESQELKVQAFFPALDEDFEMTFDLKMGHDSLADIQTQVKQQKERLAKARSKVTGGNTMKAEAAITRIDAEQLVDHVESQLDSATQDTDALGQLDRHLRDLTAAIDEVENALEWPEILEKAERHLNIAEDVVGVHGNATDKNRLATLKAELQRAVDLGNPDLLQQVIAAITSLWIPIYDHRPGAATSEFEWLVGQLSTMRNPSQAEQLIAQGRRAINNGDESALRAASRQLRLLLPGGGDRPEIRDPRTGDII